MPFMMSRSESAQPPRDNLTDIAQGVLVEETTVVLRKPRAAMVGITLSGSDKPRVTSIARAEPNQTDLRVGDIVAAARGRPAKGAVATARSIVNARTIELTIWRPVGARPLFDV